jgi:hypothetical protein
MVFKNELYDLMMNGGSFKIVDVSTLGDAVLNVDKLARFIRVVRESSPVLGEATYQKIIGSAKAISRIDMANGIVTPGRDAAGAKRIVPQSQEAEAQAFTNSLVPKELIAKLMIDYDTLEYNIEQDAFENTLMDLLGKASAEDIERFLMFSDTAITWDNAVPAKQLLSINNGWIKTAGHKIYGEDGAGQLTKDFNPDTTQADWPKPLFDALINAMPKKYISGQLRQDFRLYVPWEVENMYSELVAARPTVAGDNALLGKGVLSYKNIPVMAIPCFDDDTYTSLCGQPAMLTKPSNMYWGTKRNITVENFKDIDMRQLKNVLSLSCDSTYEDELATVVAFLDKPKVV